MTCFFTVAVFLTTSFASGMGLEKSDSLPSPFSRISKYPDTYVFQSPPPFDQGGGHIQGIQLWRNDDTDYILLSGSSSEVAYMATVSLKDNSASILSIDTLLTSPLRHAGGFQVMDNVLAVGIEDNRVRTLSKVLVYDLKAENRWKKPLYTIIREGEYERSTAGAVGMVKHGNSIVLVVADWDARNLDFYTLPERDFISSRGEFNLLASLQLSTTERSGWSDPDWHSYQNINLVSEGSQLYMVGLAKTAGDEHVADFFTVNLEPSPIANKGAQAFITKIFSQKYVPSSAADFRAGAGIHFVDGEMTLLAAPNHMSPEMGISIFWPVDRIRSSRISWIQTNAFHASQAHQAAAADSANFYAISNTEIGVYDRKDGRLLEVVTANTAKHLNSGYFFEGKLYMAHSNYPDKPDRSDIRAWQPGSQEVEVIKDLGQTDGSLTWIVRRGGYWWGMFAHYGEENSSSYLARFDADWQESARYYFPTEVLSRLGRMSVSGGVDYQDGFLVTGHDDLEIYYVRLPDSGNRLEYAGTFSAPFTGQGIAVDLLTGGLVGINRKEKKVVFGEVEHK